MSDNTSVYVKDRNVQAISTVVH